MSSDAQKNSGDFLNQEEIQLLRSEFISMINNTHTEIRKRVACRNRLFFELGISLPSSVSTLRFLKWNCLLKNRKTINSVIHIDNEEYDLNEELSDAIKTYLSVYRPEKLTEYILAGNNSEPMTNSMLLVVLKKAVELSGLQKNITVQSLRKTWAAAYIEHAEDKTEALDRVCTSFGHLYPIATLQYIYGENIPNNELKEINNSSDRTDFELCFRSDPIERIPIYISAETEEAEDGFDIVAVGRRALTEITDEEQSDQSVDVIEVEHDQFVRNRDVALYARYAANGKCALCENDAPFVTEDGPFLEVHHIIPLAEGGRDILQNTVALCPNCHRKVHRIHSEEDISKMKSRALANFELIKKIVDQQCAPDDC